MNPQLIRSRFLITMQESNGKLERIEDGYILFDEHIIEVGQYSDEIWKEIEEKFGNGFTVIKPKKSNGEKIPQHNAIILPGFVKTHGHDHESTLIGVARDVPLTKWLDDAVNPFTEFLHTHERELTEKLSKSPYLIAYTKARVDDISFGITSALTHHCNFNKYHVNELAQANDIVGTKIVIAVGSQDRNYYDKILDTPEAAIQRLDKYVKDNEHRSRVRIIPGPDQLFSNGPEILKSLKKWAKDHNSLIHIHSSEEPNTTKWFKEKYGQSPVEYANSIGFLDEKTMLAHQVNSTAEDIRIIKENDSIVVHNSLANTILGSGMPPVIDMINAGIRLAISTDGSGSADCQNMLGAARLASQYQKALHKDATLLSAEDVLKRVTSIPAKILDVNSGILESGLDADLILVDLSHPNLRPTRKSTVIENLIWASAGNEISHVYAQGKCLIKDYEFQTVELDKLLLEMDKLANLFEEYLGEAAQIKGTGANQ